MKPDSRNESLSLKKKTTTALRRYSVRRPFEKCVSNSQHSLSLHRCPVQHSHVVKNDLSLLSNCEVPSRERRRIKGCPMRRWEET